MDYMRNKEPGRNRKILSNLVVLVITACALSGCLLDRLMSLKSQLKDYDKNFSVTRVPDNGFQIRFKNPVLYASDVDWISGCKASQLLEDGRYSQSLLYLLEKDAARDDRFLIPIKVDYLKKGQEILLETVYIPEKISKVLQPELIVQCMKIGARAKKNILNRSASVSLEGIDFSGLPDESEIKTIFGPPVKNSQDGQTNYKYKYKVRSAEGKQNPVASIRFVFFKNRPNVVQQLDIDYRGFKLKVEIDRKVASIRI